MMIPFRKMQGLGNDFVVIDNREGLYSLTTAQVIAIANRRTGVGCDQLIVLDPLPAHTAAHITAAMTIYNADGSTSGACGNATRCIGGLLLAEAEAQHRKLSSVTIQTQAGLLEARQAADGLITANMGQAQLEWQHIPLSTACDTLHLPLTFEDLADPVAVSMGNPHCVFFVPDCQAVDLARLGAQIERHPLFPQRVNVEVVTIRSPQHLEMRVWERGAGLTAACGTGACASVVAAIRRGLIAGRSAVVSQHGGDLHIEWQADTGEVLMTGAWAQSYQGVWPA